MATAAMATVDVDRAPACESTFTPVADRELAMAVAAARQVVMAATAMETAMAAVAMPAAADVLPTVAMAAVVCSAVEWSVAG